MHGSTDRYGDAGAVFVEIDGDLAAAVAESDHQHLAPPERLAVPIL
jgi:hypothetical protein